MLGKIIPIFLFGFCAALLQAESKTLSREEVIVAIKEYAGFITGEGLSILLGTCIGLILNRTRYFCLV